LRTAAQSRHVFTVGQSAPNRIAGQIRLYTGREDDLLEPDTWTTMHHVDGKLLPAFEVFGDP
jgi:hypothetical protein